MTWSRRGSFKRGHVEEQQRTEALHPDTLAEDLKRYIQPLRADGSQSFRLKSQKNNETGGLDKQTASEIIERNRVRLAEMQERLYAMGHWAVLLILQGLDAAGKDSAIKHVFTGVDPQGVDVTSFKISSTLELHHDFL
jgi:polyphosphate kinase 2 (PPK2 family)